MAKMKCRSCGASFVGDARRRYCEKHTPPKRVRRPARPQHLHAIEPGETPPLPPVLKSIEEAAEAGSTLDELRLMRVRIARTLDNPNCPPRDLAALSRRQIEIAKEIDALIRQRREESDGGGLSEDEAWSEEAI
jgi:hypothetical protein